VFIFDHLAEMFADSSKMTFFHRRHILPHDGIFIDAIDRPIAVHRFVERRALILVRVADVMTKLVRRHCNIGFAKEKETVVGANISIGNDQIPFLEILMMDELSLSLDRISAALLFLAFAFFSLEIKFVRPCRFDVLLPFVHFAFLAGRLNVPVDKLFRPVTTILASKLGPVLVKADRKMVGIT
jgi:hypothetical protein